MNHELSIFNSRPTFPSLCDGLFVHTFDGITITVISECLISLGSECPKDGSEESGEECLEGVTVDCCEDDYLHNFISTEGESLDS